LRRRCHPRTYVRTLPSDPPPSLRTHVPVIANINHCAARARCGCPRPLVPVARGRLRRRLGGRPGPARRTAASASSAAAQSGAQASRGGSHAHAAALRVAHPIDCELRSCTASHRLARTGHQAHELALRRCGRHDGRSRRVAHATLGAPPGVRADRLTRCPRHPPRSAGGASRPPDLVLAA
jgi:hypothetical protein